MKIKRIKLENFIGIKHGLDRDSIEIIFPENSYKMTMISGANGSGKSTIMSALHPYKESFDDRKILILDEKEGRKEIDIEANGSLYEIIHIYSSSAQSFIKKDRVELNENGGVKTCEEIINKEFFINKDYFKIGKIGSNTKNFIDFTTSERKNYIGTFLNIEEITKAHEIVKGKALTFKKAIASISSDLDKFENKDVISTKIEGIEEEVKIFDNSLKTFYENKGSISSNLEKEKETFQAINYSEKVIEKNTLKDSLIKSKEVIEKFKNIFEKENKEELEKKLEKNISNLNLKIEVRNNELKNKNILFNDIKNNISKINLEISSLGNTEDIEKIKSELLELTKEENILKRKLKSNIYFESRNNIKKEGGNPSKMLDLFIDFTDFLEKYFSNLKENSLTSVKLNIELFLEEKYEEKLLRESEELKKIITEKNELLNQFRKEKNKEEGFVSLLDNLEKRPAECKIDDCPFIKNAIEHKDVLEKIKKKENEIELIKKDLKNLEIKLNNLNELYNLLKLFKGNYEKVKPKENKFLTKFLEEKNLIERIKGSLSNFSNERMSAISSISNLIIDLETLLTNNNKIKNLTKTQSMINDSDLTIRKKYEENLKEYLKRNEKIKNEISEIEKENNKELSELKEKTSILNNLKNYISAFSFINIGSEKIKNCKKDIEIYEKSFEKYEKERIKLNNIINTINDFESKKRIKENELNTLKIELGQIENLIKKMDALNKDFKPVDIISRALSPNEGIPLILIQVYLEETELIANELLYLAYNGDFEISFKTDSKNFFIEVRAKENIKSDIKLASQGETALTTLSISLALIEQSIGDYNILCLDEIDGPLDEKNRKFFISILSTQIEKLGIEQTFIISHNDAFDDCDMNLILLNGSPIDSEDKVIMENKNIIFDINTIKGE